MSLRPDATFTSPTEPASRAAIGKVAGVKLGNQCIPNKKTNIPRKNVATPDTMKIR